MSPSAPVKTESYLSVPRDLHGPCQDLPGTVQPAVSQHWSEENHQGRKVLHRPNLRSEDWDTQGLRCSLSMSLSLSSSLPSSSSWTKVFYIYKVDSTDVLTDIQLFFWNKKLMVLILFVIIKLLLSFISTCFCQLFL